MCMFQTITNEYISNLWLTEKKWLKSSLTEKMNSNHFHIIYIIQILVKKKNEKTGEQRDKLEMLKMLIGVIS